MHGWRWQFFSDSRLLEDVQERLRLRVLAPEHCRQLEGFSHIALEAMEHNAHWAVLAALRMCQHDTREELVVALKKAGGAESTIFHTHGSFPSAWAISFTTSPGFARVFHDSQDRNNSLGFPIRSVRILTVDINYIPSFRDSQDPECLVSQLQQMLPPLDLLPRWIEKIRQCAFSLREGHCYEILDLWVFMANGKAWLLDVSELSPHICTRLSGAAYRKQLEKQARGEGLRVGKSSVSHAEMLSLALAEGVLEMKPKARFSLQAWVMSRRALLLSVLVELGESLKSAHYDRPLQRLQKVNDRNQVSVGLVFV